MKRKKCLWSRLITLFSVVAMMALFMGMTVSAAGTKTVNMKATDKAGEYMYIGEFEDNKTTVYHKIKIKKSGIVAISAASINETTGQAENMYISLCNSKKKSLEKKSAGSKVGTDKVVYYGVKKGTYYIKVKNEKKYVVSAAFAAVSDKGGASKGKSATLKAGKQYIGVLPVGESATKADWFKFKVTKKKKLQITIENAVNGKVDFIVYGPSLPSKGSRIRMKANGDGVYTIVNASGTAIKAKKGTYYIKVVRTSSAKKASGIYSIKWNLA